MGYRHSREELLRAAVDAVRAEGIGRLSYRAVAERVGTSDRMVVYYFPSKTDLVLAVAGTLGADLRALLERAFGSDPLPPGELARRAWPVLGSPAADPVFAAFFEIIGLACARADPYAALAPGLVREWLDWLAPRVAGDTPAERRDGALAVMAQIDGLLLLRHAGGPRMAGAAARALGVA
jgi:AcrR family transcriptional regulator